MIILIYIIIKIIFHYIKGRKFVIDSELIALLTVSMFIMVSTLNTVTQLNLCPSSNDNALDQLEESINFVDIPLKAVTPYLLYESLKAANYLLNESNNNMVKEKIKAYILAYNGLIDEEDVINNVKRTIIENPNIDIYDIVSIYILPKDLDTIKHLTAILRDLLRVDDFNFLVNTDQRISSTSPLHLSTKKDSYYFYININISKIYEWYLEHKQQIELKENLKIENLEFVNNYFLTQLTTMIANGNHEYINSLCIYNLNLVEHGDLVAHLIGLSL